MRRLPQLRLITNSEVKCFRSCAERHHIEYVLGYRPAAQSDALRFGSLVHLGLEAWWSFAKAGALTMASADALLDAAIATISVEADPYDRARAAAMLVAYHARWLPALEELEVLGVELEFDVPLVNPQTGHESKTYRVGGKLDVLVRSRRTGRVEVVEHKTSSEDLTPGGDYWRRLRIDSQVSTYRMGAASLGYDVSGILYDVLGKPDLRPLRATPSEARKYTKATKTEPSRLYAGQREADETPEEYAERVANALAKSPDKYLGRAEIVRLDAEISRAAADLWDTARLIREAELADRHPRNPDACVQWGRSCAYMPVCSGEAELTDYRYTRVDNRHQELSGITATAEETA